MEGTSQSAGQVRVLRSGNTVLLYSDKHTTENTKPAQTKDLKVSSDAKKHETKDTKEDGETESTTSTTGTQTESEILTDFSSTKRKRPVEELAIDKVIPIVKKFTSIGTGTDGSDITHDDMVDMATTTDESYTDKTFHSTGTETDLNSVGDRKTLESLLRWALSICTSDSLDDILGSENRNGSCPRLPVGTQLQRRFIANTEKNTTESYIAISSSSTHLHSNGIHSSSTRHAMQDVIFPAISPKNQSVSTSTEIGASQFSKEKESEFGIGQHEQEVEEAMEVQESEHVSRQHWIFSPVPRFLSKKELLELQPSTHMPEDSGTSVTAVTDSSFGGNSSSFLTEFPRNASENLYLSPQKSTQVKEMSCNTQNVERNGCSTPVIVDSFSLQPAVQSQMTSSALASLAEQGPFQPEHPQEALARSQPEDSVLPMQVPNASISDSPSASQPVIIDSWSLQGSRFEIKPTSVLPSAKMERFQQEALPSTEVPANDSSNKQSELAANALVSLSSTSVSDDTKEEQSSSSKVPVSRTWSRSESSPSSVTPGEKEPIVIWPPQFTESDREKYTKTSEPVIVESFSLKPGSDDKSVVQKGSNAASDAIDQSELAAAALVNLSSITHQSGLNCAFNEQESSGNSSSRNPSKRTSTSPTQSDQPLKVARETIASTKGKPKTVKDILKSKEHGKMAGKSAASKTSDSRTSDLHGSLAEQASPSDQNSTSTSKAITSGVHGSRSVTSQGSPASVPTSLTPALLTLSAEQLTLACAQQQASSRRATSALQDLSKKASPHTSTMALQTVTTSQPQAAGTARTYLLAKVSGSEKPVMIPYNVFYVPSQATCSVTGQTRITSSLSGNVAQTGTQGRNVTLAGSTFVNTGQAGQTGTQAGKSGQGITIVNSTSQPSEQMATSFLQVQPFASNTTPSGATGSSTDNRIIPIQLLQPGSVAFSASATKASPLLMIPPQKSGFTGSSQAGLTGSHVTLGAHQYKQTVQSQIVTTPSGVQAGSFSKFYIPTAKSSVSVTTSSQRSGVNVSGAHTSVTTTQPAVSTGVTPSGGQEGVAPVTSTRGASVPLHIAPVKESAAPSTDKDKKTSTGSDKAPTESSATREHDYSKDIGCGSPGPDQSLLASTDFSDTARREANNQGQETTAEKGASEIEAANALINMPNRTGCVPVDVKTEPVEFETDIGSSDCASASNETNEETIDPGNSTNGAGESSYLDIDDKTCEQCGKSFKNRSQLKVHYRVHTKERPYQCGVCKKKFIQLGHVTSHVLIHSTLRPYQCGICKKTFRQKGTLKEHMPVHSGEKPFKCKWCDARFAFRTLLRKHRKQDHPAEEGVETDVQENALSPPPQSN